MPEQVYECISIAWPECPQKNDKLRIQLRGACATREEAADHAKRLQKEDPTFDSYVVGQYK